jgi:hypothetical protein
MIGVILRLLGIRSGIAFLKRVFGLLVYGGEKE